MIDSAVTSINVTYNVALVMVDNLPNNMKFISDILNEIAKQNINIDMISQAPPYRRAVNLSFSLPSESLVNAISTLNKFKKDEQSIHIGIDADNTKLSVFGEKMRDIPGVAARLYRLLSENNIEVKLVTTSEIDISFLIYDKDADRAIEIIKSTFSL